MRRRRGGAPVGPAPETGSCRGIGIHLMWWRESSTGGYGMDEENSGKYLGSLTAAWLTVKDGLQEVPTGLILTSDRRTSPILSNCRCTASLSLSSFLWASLSLSRSFWYSSFFRCHSCLSSCSCRCCFWTSSSCREQGRVSTGSYNNQTNVKWLLAVCP